MKTDTQGLRSIMGVQMLHGSPPLALGEPPGVLKKNRFGIIISLQALKRPFV